MKHRRVTLVFPLLLLCLAGGCSGKVQDETERLNGLPRLSAVRLPRTRSVPTRYSFLASPGVVEEAQAKAPTELMVYEVIREAPTRDMAVELAGRLGGTVSEARFRELPST